MDQAIVAGDLLLDIETSSGSVEGSARSSSITHLLRQSRTSDGHLEHWTVESGESYLEINSSTLLVSINNEIRPLG
jgi:hypothetical protein